MDATVFLGQDNIDISQALKIIDGTSCGVMYVVDSDRKLLGCVTDGDVRRALIKGMNLSDNIKSIMNSAPKYIFKEETSSAEAIMEQYNITSLPVLSRDFEVIEVFARGKVMEKRDAIATSLIDYPAVIMAGGEGKRLLPYTKILPKPLIPIGDVPIVERIIAQFFSYGVRDYFITVNYKKRMIESYFSDVAMNYDIRYVEEDKPLGTAGSLKLLDGCFNKPFFVTNCDILIHAEYDKIMQSHIRNENAITIVTAMKNLVIPYGVVKMSDEGTVKNIQEKPNFSHLINTGMYVLNPEVISIIPDDSFYHMTDLIGETISKGLKVGIYPIGEDAFFDMGEFEEMKRMEDKLMNRG